MGYFSSKTHFEMDELMEALNTKSLKDELEKHSISMAFQGEFSKDILALVSATLRKIPNSQAVSKRIFALVVEMAQNIHHYSAKRVFSPEYKREIGVGILAISETSDHFMVCSGNYISPENIEEVSGRFEEINHLDDEALRKLYKARRKLPQREDKPGANLGFIDMRRKSGNPIDCMFKQIDQNQAFFILSVKINKF